MRLSQNKPFYLKAFAEEEETCSVLARWQGLGPGPPLSAWTRVLLIPNKSCSLSSKREISSKLGILPSNTNFDSQSPGFCRHLCRRLCGREQALSTGEPSDHTAGFSFIFFLSFLFTWLLPPRWWSRVGKQTKTMFLNKQ